MAEAAEAAMLPGLMQAPWPLTRRQPTRKRRLSSKGLRSLEALKPLSKRRLSKRALLAPLKTLLTWAALMRLD
ncbi:MAG: hypothetical protein CMJ17_00255 [Phenylobacterium sp.]|nr:hypothetical protein [Phenylobacterium sp.]